MTVGRESIGCWLVDRIITTTEVLGRLDVDIATPKDPAGLANVTLFGV